MGIWNRVLSDRTEPGCCSICGPYVDDTIIVFRRVQNTGLADILFLRCMEHRNKLPITTALNENALRLFKRVRKREVEKAKREGCNVPEKVLEEFPDLKDGNCAQSQLPRASIRPANRCFRPFAEVRVRVLNDRNCNAAQQRP